jgi:cold shock CspA family protein
VSVVPLNGVVRAFDDARGLGEIVNSDGTLYAFHCTQIADGTRTIAAGAAVTFEVRPWHRGQLEAVQIRAI